MSDFGAQLGADGVLRYGGLQEFLRALSEIQSTGVVETNLSRPLQQGATVQLQIEAPRLNERLAAEALVAAVEGRRAHLKLLHFDDELMPELFFLAQRAEALLSGPQPAASASPGQERRPRRPRAGAAPSTSTTPARAVDPRRARIYEERVSADLSLSPPPAPREAAVQPLPLSALTPLDAPQPSAVELAPVAAPPPPTPARARSGGIGRSDRTAEVSELSADLPPPPSLPLSALTPISPVDAAPAGADAPTFSQDLAFGGLATPPPPSEAGGWAPAPTPVTPDARVPPPRAPSVGAELADLPSQLPALNPAGFVERGLPLPRLSARGVLRLPDLSSLLGVYLSELRHGLLTVFGGPEAELGGELPVKIALGQVVKLSARLRARVGEVRLLDVADAEPVRALLASRAAELWPALEALIPAPGASPAAAPPSSAPAVEAAPARAQSAVSPPVEVTLPKGMTGTADLLQGSGDTGPLPLITGTVDLGVNTGPLPRTSAPAPSAGAAPQLPRRLPGRLIYASVADLRQSVDQELVGGGLFVQSDPVPMRSREILKVEVAGAPVPGVEVEVEVVYVDGGRVGYSVKNVVSVIEALRAFSGAGGAPDPRAEQAPVALGQAQALTGDVEPTRAPITGDVSELSGRLAAPIPERQLFGLQALLCEDVDQLDGQPLLVVFEYIARKGWRGVLTVTRPEYKLKIWFHEGSVAFVEQRPADEALALGRILVTQRRISEHQLRQALEKSRASERALGRTLVLLGHIKKSGLSAAIRTQTRTILDRAFLSGAGSYRWEPWSEPPGRADLVLVKGPGVVSRHLRAVFESMPGDRVDSLFKGRLGRRTQLVADWDERAGQMRLGPKEVRYLENSFSRPTTVFDTLAGSGLGRLTTLKLVASCVCAGVLRFVDGEDEQSISSSHSALIESRLEDELRRIQGLNHFEVLGVHWSAHYRHYGAALQKALAPFEPNSPNMLGAERPALDTAAEIRNRIRAAFDVLISADRRAQYRRQLFDPTERQYSADMLVKQAEVALMRGDRVSALETLETAVELDPSDRNRGLLTTAREGRT